MCCAIMFALLWTCVCWCVYVFVCVQSCLHFCGQVHVGVCVCSYVWKLKVYFVYLPFSLSTALAEAGSLTEHGVFSVLPSLASQITLYMTTEYISQVLGFWVIVTHVQLAYGM